MLPKRNYYLNDYFDIFNMQLNREKEYMKTDIYEKNNNYILEVDLPGIKKEHIEPSINILNGVLGFYPETYIDSIDTKLITISLSLKIYKIFVVLTYWN